jgi:putative transposase
MKYIRTIQSGGTFFFTLITNNRIPIFNSSLSVTTLRNAFQYVKSRHPFSIDAFVLLPDHLHCIWTLPGNDSNYSKRWNLIKRTFSRNFLNVKNENITLSRISKRERGIWQRRFWEHLVRDEDDFVRCVEYIHYNPVKHGLVVAPFEWPYSSFHKFVKRGIYDLNWGSYNDSGIFMGE